MAEESIPLLGLIDRLYGGGSQAPLASMPAMDSPGVYINPVTGDPMSPQMVAKQAAMMRGMGRSAVDAGMVPGAAIQPNPYPAGSEEAAWYDQNRQQAMADWAPGMALGMIGGGAPFAEAGALGAAGGRMAATRNPITGKLQVAPQQRLTDAFIAGGSPVEVEAYVPLRANGKFANQRDWARAQRLTPEKETAPDVLRQPNQLYDFGNPPAPTASRLEMPQVNVAPSDLARWLAFMQHGAL